MVKFQILDGSRMWVMREDIISVREHIGKPSTIAIRTHIPQRPVEVYDLLTEADALIKGIGLVRGPTGR